MDQVMATQELVSTFEAELRGARTDFAMAALVIYEHILTLKYEIDFLFRRKWNASTWIFVFNRYFLLASVLYNSGPSSHCANSQAEDALDYIAEADLPAVPSLAFTVLRVFAILPESSWRRATVCILATLACATIALDSYVQFTQVWVYVNDPILGSSCFGLIPPGAVAIATRVEVATSVIAIVLNGLAFVITATRTASQVQRASSIGLGTTLSEILLRDGSIFFLATLILSIFDSIPVFNVNSLFNGLAAYILAPITDIIPRIVLSRFIINLRQVHTPTTKSSVDQHTSRFSTINFRIPTSDEVIGNLGEPLEFVDYRVDDEDDALNGRAETAVSANLGTNMDRQGEGAEGMLGVARGWADLEAGPSDGGRKSVEADGHVVDVQLEELRLDPSPPV